MFLLLFLHVSRRQIIKLKLLRSQVIKDVKKNKKKREKKGTNKTHTAFDFSLIVGQYGTSTYGIRVLKPNEQSINIMNHNQPEFDYSVVIELKIKASKKNPKLVTFTKLFLKTKQV